MSNTYKTLFSTLSYGQYQEAGRHASLEECKTRVRVAAGCRLLWRQEGSDVAAYRCVEDMSDADKAYARIRVAG